MKKILTIFVLCFCLFTSCRKDESMEALTARVFHVAEAQAMEMAENLGPDTTPRTFEAGKFVTMPIDWWCSGFFPGSLWYIYEFTHNDEIKELAEKESLKIESMKYVDDHHDVGFQINSSFGNWYRLTGDDHALSVMRTAAKSLTKSFSDKVGCIKSWPFVLEGFSWTFPVIIDNMMNLEILMKIGNLDQNEELKHIAVSHANTTMKNHFRDDYSCCHLVDYDSETGDVIKRITVQGLADDSAWARGQAWAVYGYTMMYKYTDDERYLSWAENVADMVIANLPEDGVPYWDFDAPEIPDALRDASAAAVLASAFIDLSSFSNKGETYLKVAEKQIRTLAGPEYLAEPGANGNFLLKHSVGSLPANSEVDVPLTYADYYFLEALLKYKRIKQ